MISNQSRYIFVTLGVIKPTMNCAKTLLVYNFKVLGSGVEQVKKL